jgi:hypothetical protein
LAGIAEDEFNLPEPNRAALVDLHRVKVNVGGEQHNVALPSVLLFQQIGEADVAFKTDRLDDRRVGRRPILYGLEQGEATGVSQIHLTVIATAVAPPLLVDIVEKRDVGITAEPINGVEAQLHHTPLTYLYSL